MAHVLSTHRVEKSRHSASRQEGHNEEEMFEGKRWCFLSVIFTTQELILQRADGWLLGRSNHDTGKVAHYRQWIWGLELDACYIPAHWLVLISALCVWQFFQCFFKWHTKVDIGNRERIKHWFLIRLYPWRRQRKAIQEGRKLFMLRPSVSALSFQD